MGMRAILGTTAGGLTHSHAWTRNNSALELQSLFTLLEKCWRSSELMGMTIAKSGDRSLKSQSSREQIMSQNHDSELAAREVGATIPSRRPSRRIVFAIVFLASLCGIGVGLRYLPDLSWVVERESSLRNQIATHPYMSWTVGLLVYVALSMLPGTAGKSIVFGWLFGFVAALIIVEIGLTGAAIISFLLGRFVVKRLLHLRWQVLLQAFSRRFEQDGAFYLLWLRLAHAPLTLVNYGAGATNVPLVTFWWTTHLGILPASLVYVFLGSRIPNLSVVIDKGAWAIVDPPLLVVLATTAFLPPLIRPWIARIGKGSRP